MNRTTPTCRLYHSASQFFDVKLIVYQKCSFRQAKTRRSLNTIFVGSSCHHWCAHPRNTQSVLLSHSSAVLADSVDSLFPFALVCCIYRNITSFCHEVFRQHVYDTLQILARPSVQAFIKITSSRHAWPSINNDGYAHPCHANGHKYSGTATYLLPCFLIRTLESNTSA